MNTLFAEIKNYPLCVEVESPCTGTLWFPIPQAFLSSPLPFSSPGEERKEGLGKMATFNHQSCDVVHVHYAGEIHVEYV